MKKGDPVQFKTEDGGDIIGNIAESFGAYYLVLTHDKQQMWYLPAEYPRK